ncbi:MAG: hypothetical protein AAGH87_08830 [Pseudomonadota bacterium]
MPGRRVARAPAPAPRHTPLDLEAIEEALERLETGEFGYCGACHGQIEIERLCEDPTVDRCKSCADED